MKLVFIGGGNMAGAMIGGLTKAQSAFAIHVIERDRARRQQLQDDFDVTVADHIGSELSDAQVIVLAVKPNDLQGVCEALRPLLAQVAQQPMLLSIAAGISSDCLATWCGSQAVVRAMPNTPALVGQGMTGLYARAAVTPEQRQQATNIIAATGHAIWLDDEAKMDAVTAISGSGPAYVFYFLEALQQAATRVGLTEAQGRQLALQTFVGATQLAAQSSEPVSVLRDRVTSKGGTTAAAIAYMADHQLPDIIMGAALAAQARSQEMAKAYGNG